MLDSGVSAEVVKSYIQNAPVISSITADEIVALNQRGVPSDILVAMLRRNGELRSQATAPPPNAGPASGVAQPLVVPQAPVTYPATEPAVYAPEPTYAVAPSSYSYYYYSYPSYYYPYWSYPYYWYPYYSSWWFTPGWNRYHYGHYYYPNYHHGGNGYHHGGNPGYHPAPHTPYRWADAYPNRIVTGPNWGADRGFAGRPVGTPPYRGAPATRAGAPGFAGRSPVAAPHMGGGSFAGRTGGYAVSAGRSGGFAGGGARGSGGRR